MVKSNGSKCWQKKSGKVLKKMDEVSKYIKSQSLNTNNEDGWKKEPLLIITTAVIDLITV